MNNRNKKIYIFAGVIYIILIGLGVYSNNKNSTPQTVDVIDYENDSYASNVRTGPEFLGTKVSTINFEKKCFSATYNEIHEGEALVNSYFSDFEIVNGVVNGNLLYQQMQSDSYVGKIEGFAFYDEDYIILETVANGTSEGQSFEDERVFRYSLTTGSFEYGEGLKYPASDLSAKYINKTELNFVLALEEVDCN